MTFTKWVRICDEGEQKWQEYQQKVADMTPQELIAEFISYLDYYECRGEDNSPRKYIQISCGRVMMIEPLNEVLTKMREIAHAV